MDHKDQEVREEQLTIDWIINMLKTKGIIGNQIVIDRLMKATHKELYDLNQDAMSEIYKRYLFIEEKEVKK